MTRKTLIPAMDQERIMAALRIATEQYRKDAATSDQHDEPHIATQFRQQAVDAERIADEIDAAEFLYRE